MNISFGDKRLPDRFWSKVSVEPSGCWEWTGARTSFGYGQIRVSGKAMLAHRMMAEIAYGPGGDQYALHSCDNPPCVNPGHLRWGSARDNVQDAIQRQRLIPGMKQLQKTHCPEGHEYSEDNTYITKSGARTCRECYRANWRKWNSKRRERGPVRPREARHGTGSEYAWGCRCDECKNFKRLEAQKYRARKKAKEGDDNG